MLESVQIKYDLVVNPEGNLYRWKVDAYPALIYSVCCGMMLSPYGWPKSEGFYFGHDFYWYNEWPDIWGNGDKYIRDHLKRSSGDLPPGYYREYEKVFRGLEHWLKKLEKIDFKKMDLPGLRRLWFGFFNFYSYEFWRIVTISEVLSYAASHRMEKEIAKAKVSLSPEEISRLTIFPEKSFLMTEEYELLKIAQAKSAKRRQGLLKEHVRKFYWILNGYHGVKELDERFFNRRLREISGSGILEKIFHLQNYYRQTTNDFRNLVKKYGLNPEIVKYAKLAQRASYLQDKRKGISLIATDYIVKMYECLARHLSISIEQALYILWTEFDRAVADQKLLAELPKRQKSCRLRMTSKGTILSLKSTAAAFRIFERRYLASSGQEVKGIVAYPGSVQGRVKIIRNRQEIKSFKNGQILVALMTSPDYIVAIKKAKAIVTDDGGLTCHAAIIARELKKPCIVGTRNATQALKDGDLIAVDADKGTVKIIK